MSPSIQSKPHSPRGQYQSPTILSPKSPRGQYVPSSSNRPSALRDITFEPDQNRSSFVSATSVVLLQHARTETPSLPLEHESHPKSELYSTIWTIVTSIAIGAVFITVVVLFECDGVLFLSSYIVSILNYEMSWYSYAIIQKLLRPFQLYYEMDLLAPYRDTKKAVTIADSWSASAGISPPLMAFIISTLVMLFCSGVVSIIQLFGNLGLATGMFYTILPFVASTTFVAVGCAMYTPTPIDGSILLLQQIAFSIYSFNSFLSYRESVNGKIRQIILIGGGFALAIVFVPIVILRIFRSTEVARTGITLFLDLFFLQYIPSMLMLLNNEMDSFLNPNFKFPDHSPQHRLYAIISCFLIFWATDLIANLFGKASKWVVVAAGYVAVIFCHIILKFLIAPTDVPLCEWYHFLLMFIGSCLYHVGATFVTFLRYMAKDSCLRSQWLVRLQYILLLGFFLTIYERIEWSANFNFTVQAKIDNIIRTWQRIDNSTYNDFIEEEMEFQLLKVVTRLIETVHRIYTPEEMNQMFVRSSHRFILNLGSCVVESVQANVTGKECFSAFH